MARDQQDGYIMIDRGIVESEIWNKPPLYIKVWLLLIIKAQHADYKGLRRGQLYTSIDEIREACAWKSGWRKEKPSKDQIWNILEWLRNPSGDAYGGNHGHDNGGGMVTTRKATHGMLVNICNYNVYQDPKRYGGNNGSDRETTTGELRGQREADNTNKNVKNDKNDKNNTLSPQTPPSPKPLRNVIPPTIEMLAQYASERAKEGHPPIDANEFFDFYESKGWKVGKERMKDWQAAYRTWEKKREQRQGQRKPSQNTLMHMLEEGRFDE